MNPTRGLPRREFLRVGSLAGLGLAQFLEMQARGANVEKKEINCIFIFILGGMPHQDMWDLKPEAPSEIRGDFSPISTAVPGVQISDVLPGVAKVTDKLAILRSVTHGDSDHGNGFHVMMTGLKPAPGAGNLNGNKKGNTHPSLGSMVAKLGRCDSPLPPYVSVPNFIDSGGPSFLESRYSPFVIPSDPAGPEFEVRDVSLPESVATGRGNRRRAALRELERLDEKVDRLSKGERAMGEFYEKAWSLMTSKKAKVAFDIHREKKAVREQYGMTSLGQCCLLGRRLVEAGCRFVTIENGHWDTHRKNTMSLRKLLVPSFDRAIPALLNDLDERGLLDSTLVVVTTEFGRTPRINKLAGRDHWPNAFSICMAGAGLKSGLTLGATDKRAAYVADRPITPGDVSATILRTLGIDPKSLLYTPLGRPVPAIHDGKPISELTG